MNFPPPLHTPNKRAKIKQHLVEQILLTVYSEPTVSPKSFCLYLGFSWGLLAVHMTYLWSWQAGVTYIFHDCWFWRITLVTSIDFWARNIRLNPALLYCLTMIVKYFHWNRDIMQFPEDDIHFWLVLSKTDEVMPVSVLLMTLTQIYIYIYFFLILIAVSISWFWHHLSPMTSPIDPALILRLRFIFFMRIILFAYYFPPQVSILHVHFMHFFILTPVTPLGHQPGSLLHQQYHPVLCKSRCLHTKLPICTLPALRRLHGSRGPEEHAPAAWGSSALRCPARPLPAGTHCLSAWLPRWVHLSERAWA